MDYHVIRSAECSTNHQLLRVTYRLPQPLWRQRKSVNKSVSRSPVGQICCTPDKNDDEKEECAQKEYCSHIEEGLAEWDKDLSVEAKWSYLKSVVINAASSTLCCTSRPPPDWLAAKAAVLEPLSAQRNTLYISGHLQMTHPSVFR